MLFKLKSQFEELRSRVVFLERVKKYLEVRAELLSSLPLPLPHDSRSWECFLMCLKILSVDRWGLEASLLPSLAVSGPASLDLQASEEPSVLCFGGKGSLQSGSPLGLMAYLYARCPHQRIFANVKDELDPSPDLAVCLRSVRAAVVMSHNNTILTHLPLASLGFHLPSDLNVATVRVRRLPVFGQTAALNSYTHTSTLLPVVMSLFW